MDGSFWDVSIWTIVCFFIKVGIALLIVFFVFAMVFGAFEEYGFKWIIWLLVGLGHGRLSKAGISHGRIYGLSCL